MNELATETWWSHAKYLGTTANAAENTEWFNYLNSIAIWSRDLFNELWQIELTGYILLGFAAVITAIGIAILVNQRKIKKQLRQLLEQKETNEADKPQE